MNSKDFYVEVSLFFSPMDEERAGWVEAVLSDLPYESFLLEEGALPCLKAYIRQEDYDARALKLLLSDLPFPVRTAATQIAPQNWNAAWESEFTPIIVDNRVVVKSLTHTDADVAAAKAQAGVRALRSRYNIRINPQMAFGTGHHQTTYMMMQAMLDAADVIRDGIVLDMGCGTGVLAILAAKMGAKKTYAIDIDAVAAESAFWNACSNRLSRRIETACGDASLLQMGRYDVILANIHRNILLQDMPTYVRSLRRGGVLLLSGFYDSDIADLIDAAAGWGLLPQGRLSREGWACLRFCKNNHNQSQSSV